MTEDDTFDALRRIPDNEILEIYYAWDANIDRHYEDKYQRRAALDSLLAKYHWSRRDFAILYNKTNIA